MPKSTNSISVPIHGRFSFQNFLSKFGDAAIATLNLDTGDAIRALSGAFGGKFDEPESQAYILLWQSMKGAVENILNHYFEQEFDSGKRQVEVFARTKSFCQTLYQDLPGLKLEIDRDFITNPVQHETTKKLHDFFKNWVRSDLNLDENTARVVAAGFPRLLLKEMAGLPRNDFGQLFKFFEKPFLPAEEKAIAFENYAARLLGEFDRPAFGDRRISLAEMYVPPFFRFFKPKNDPTDERRPDDRESFVAPTEPILLENFLDGWLDEKLTDEFSPKNARLMLLLGQPGQGKSSFCLRNIYRLLAEKPGEVERVFLVKLKDLEGRDEFLKRPLQVVLDHLKNLPLRNVDLKIDDLRGGLLFLDGLDEFYMNHGLSHDDVDNLLRNLNRDLRMESENGNPFRCLITSRTNYVRLDRVKTENILTLQIAEMTLAEQNNWLDRFEKVNERVFKNDDPAEAERKQNFVAALRPALQKLAESTDEKDKNLLALVNQPILLQIVVEAEINPAEAENRAKLYESLFDKIVERKWGGGQIRSLEKLSDEAGKRKFREFLRALALQIFYSDREYARRSDFLEKPLAEAVENLRKFFGGQTDERDFLKNLLVSFYFREVKKDADDKIIRDENHNHAYEFMHKSLQEYLVAEAIWVWFRENLTETKRNGDPVISDEQAMAEVFDLFSPRLLTPEIVDYLYDFAKKDADKNFLETQLFPRTKKLIAGLAEHSFLWKYDAMTAGQHPSRRRSTPLEQSVAVFYGILTVNSALVGRLAEGIEWPGALEGDYLELRQKLEDRFNFIPESVDLPSFFYLLTQNATILNLQGQNFDGYNLCGVRFSGSNFRGCSFQKVDFPGTYLFYSNFHGSDFSGAHMNRSIGFASDFIGANFKNVSFRNAFLQGSDFSNSNLDNSQFGEADVSGADFKNADLINASFENAELEYFEEDVQGDGIMYGSIVQNLHLARNVEKADWRGTIFEHRDWSKGEKWEAEAEK